MREKVSKNLQHPGDQSATGSTSVTSYRAVPIEQILRRPAVQTITGLSRSTLYEMMADGRFPKPVRLGLRAVGWRERDVAEWVASREQASA